MEFRRLEIPDVVLILPRRLDDSRGWFAETFSAPHFAAFGLVARFVQENHSCSHAAGTIRGLHFQLPPYAQAKLVRAVRGAAYDVAVDLRRNSPHYGRFVAAPLTADRGEELFVPAGFAHGYCTLEPETEIVYSVDHGYVREADSGIHCHDPDLAIPWPVQSSAAVLSERDRGLPHFRDFDTPFL